MKVPEAIHHRNDPNNSTDSARTALPPSRYGPSMVQCLQALPGVGLLEEVAGVFINFLAIGFIIAPGKIEDDDDEDDDDDDEDDDDDDEYI